MSQPDIGISDLIEVYNGGNIDEQKAQELLDKIDPAQIQQGIRKLVETYLAPHMADIRENVDQYPDAQEVRAKYREQPDEWQEETFHGAVQDLYTLAAEIRERPNDGLYRLKEYLRDPTVLEALLLIFENPSIDAEYREQLKDYTATQFYLIGVMLAPEMYKQHEVEEALDIMNISQDMREAVMRDYRAQTR